MADEEGSHADQEENIARGHEEDVARAAEELRRDEEPRRPEIHPVPPQEVSQGSRAQQWQERRFHGVRQVRSLDAADPVQHAGEEEKGTRNVPERVFSHSFSLFGGAS